MKPNGANRGRHLNHGNSGAGKCAANPAVANYSTTDRHYRVLLSRPAPLRNSMPRREFAAIVTLAVSINSESHENRRP